MLRKMSTYAICLCHFSAHTSLLWLCKLMQNGAKDNWIFTFLDPACTRTKKVRDNIDLGWLSPGLFLISHCHFSCFSVYNEVVSSPPASSPVMFKNLVPSVKDLIPVLTDIPSAWFKIKKITKLVSIPVIYSSGSSESYCLLPTHF